MATFKEKTPPRLRTRIDTINAPDYARVRLRAYLPAVAPGLDDQECVARRPLQFTLPMSDGRRIVRFDQLEPRSLRGGVLLTIHRLSEGGAPYTFEAAIAAHVEAVDSLTRGVSVDGLSQR